MARSTQRPAPPVSTKPPMRPHRWGWPLACLLLLTVCGDHTGAGQQATPQVLQTQLDALAKLGLPTSQQTWDAAHPAPDNNPADIWQSFFERFGDPAHPNELLWATPWPNDAPPSDPIRTQIEACDGQAQALLHGWFAEALGDDFDPESVRDFNAPLALFTLAQQAMDDVSKQTRSKGPHDLEEVNPFTAPPGSHPVWPALNAQAQALVPLALVAIDPWLNFFEQAAAQPVAKFDASQNPLNGSTEGGAPLRLMGIATGMFEMRAIWRAHQGDRAGAAEDVRRIGHIAQQLGQAPTIQQGLVAMRRHRVALVTSMRLAQMGDWSANELMLLQQALPPQPTPQGWMTPVMGEIVHVTLEWERLLPDQYHGSLPPQWAKELPRNQAAFIAALRPTLQTLQQNRWPRRDVPIQSQDPSANMADQYLGAIAACNLAAQRLAAAHEVTQAGLAMLTHHAATGQWADQWEDLVPTHLSHVPLDLFSTPSNNPADWQPLNMRRDGDAVVVYSLGDDMKDNQGLAQDLVGLSNKFPRTNQGLDTDIVFNIHQAQAHFFPQVHAAFFNAWHPLQNIEHWYE